MRDNGIIKALECFAISKDFDEIDCIGCAFNTKSICCENCSDGIAKASLDLINRQKAEIERLNKEVDRLSQTVMYNDSITDMKTTEAIREFAEKLRETLSNLEANSPNKHYKLGMQDMLDYYVPKIINDVVKEIIGDVTDVGVIKERENL